ncbi:MAG: DNA ligase [Aliarcobacter sp.]|nr:DNA ligase [Aliarcobacter sp.]
MRFLLLVLIYINLYSSELQKAKIYDKSKHNITNWYMSEKLDGIRACWNGKEFISKNGNKIYAPDWFIKDFPNFELDGELWTKRDDFENIQNIVLDEKPTQKWNEITYNIFEVPNADGNFDKRLEKIKSYLYKNPNKFIKIIPQKICKNESELNSYLKELVNKKAEGLILKNPKLDYFTGRSENILKVKKFYDNEALVIGLNYSKDNKFKSLKVRLKNGVIFNLGGGFSDKQRENPPKIGDIVTFKYYDLTKNNKPKFASFLRIRKKE